MTRRVTKNCTTRPPTCKRPPGKSLLTSSSRNNRTNCAGSGSTSIFQCLTNWRSRLPAAPTASSAKAAKGIREQTKEAIAQGVGEEFGLIRSAMSPVVHELRSTVDAVAGERKNLSKDRKKFASVGLAYLAIGSVLAAFGSATYSASKLKEARQAQQTLGHLRELDALSTARCGDGYCASVDLKDKVEHNGKTYYRIKPRDEQ